MYIQSATRAHQKGPLTFPPEARALITPYLPPSITITTTTTTTQSQTQQKPREYPHVTLTYAHSLDASLALAPGIRTVLSGPESKAMTHFLRAHHDAILVGAGTAVADDPGLNSRLLPDPDLEAAGERQRQRQRQPRPVVLDPKGRWAVHEGSKVVRIAREGKGLGPWVLVADNKGHGTGVVDEGRRRVVEEVGGRYIPLEARAEGERFEWVDVLGLLKREGLESVMIEGGGEVINSLLAPPGNGLVDSVIVTIAPTWLGQGGVVVSPPRTVGEDGQPGQPVRLTGVTWCPLGEDVVLCGRIPR
ncbi:dihydrofolate reductase-like domain-containing protein [Achaetomium macrosporum]|uniref:2,5-diamino-6-ribosylamino-4(3H)-pyrimidinone 5'-phosphate reductase n=1 Tax=Achaetomium macrosporum TaxID=79813 RepID=A0AAN7C5H7_9PEZI|nr:dihydrofolate reductase-like domain-containing protein [Achaetomium macrosporum]